VSLNKPLSKQHPLHHASKEMIAAIDFYQKMLFCGVDDFATFESYWLEFLQKLERVWNKIQAAVCSYPRWSRLEGEINRLRNNDALLVYLRHARNADEHSLQSIAADWDANLRASQVDAGHVLIEWEPWDRPLLTVKNRGVLYHPPRTHLGKNFEHMLKKGTAEPVVVAVMALHFYKNLLNRIITEVLNHE
jgi:hypothetical protein